MEVLTTPEMSRARLREEAEAPVITFGVQVCTDLEQGSQREWLLADGVGGCPTGPVSGLRTCRSAGPVTIAETPSRRRLAVASTGDDRDLGR
jgi:hypothetical protein